MSDTLDLALDDRAAGQAANLAAGTSGHRDDRARVETAVAALALLGDAFTADDVHDALRGGDPYDRNLVSSVLGCWARDGRIREDTARRPVASCHRARHASRNRWWVGGAR